MSVVAESNTKFWNGTMEQQVKRIKYVKESAVNDIASSIDNIATSVTSLSESYNDILRVNATVVRYLQNVEKREKAETAENIETSIREKR